MPMLGQEGMIMSGARKPKKPERDEDREERIEMEIVVDAHDHEERAMGWFYYLEDTLSSAPQKLVHPKWESCGRVSHGGTHEQAKDRPRSRAYHARS